MGRTLRIACGLFWCAVAHAGPTVPDGELREVPPAELRPLATHEAELRLLEQELEEARATVDAARDAIARQQEALEAAETERNVATERISVASGEADAASAEAWTRVLREDGAVDAASARIAAARARLRAAREGGDPDLIDTRAAELEAARRIRDLAGARRKEARVAYRQEKRAGEAAVEAAKEVHRHLQEEIDHRKDALYTARGLLQREQEGVDLLEARRALLEAQLELDRAQLAVEHGADLDLDGYADAVDDARSRVERLAPRDRE